MSEPARGDVLDPTSDSEARAGDSPVVVHEAFSTLRAGFLLLDDSGRAVSEVDQTLVDLGMTDFSAETLERFRHRAVDVNGDPLRPGHTPVFDAIFRDVQMNDVVIGFRLKDAPATDGGPAPAETFRWMRMDSRRVLVDGVERTLVTAVDITALRRAEEQLRSAAAELRDSERRFSVVFEHIGDVITVIDETGQVKFGTPSGERILGWPRGNRAAAGVLDLVHPEDRDRAAAALAGVVDGTRGPTDPVIVRIGTASGEWRYMECVGVNMLDEPSIEGIVVTARDITERHRLTMQLEHAATHDQLTGLPNRAMFAEHLGTALARRGRRGSSVALCYLDIDGFKKVNDAHGHATGDLLLEQMADRIRECIRASDVPSRLGGDELALILEDVDEPTAVMVASRIGERLQAPYELGSVAVSCGASIGVALAMAGDTPEKWLDRADRALYAAKRAGGHAVRIAGH